MSKKIIILIRTLAFLLLFAVALFYVQDVLTPDHDWPSISRRTTKTLAGYQAEPDNTIKILFAGTSHMMYGVTPMEIYRNTGVPSYNYGSIGQNVPETYYLLKLAFETQSPEVLVLDTSAFFMNETRVNSHGIWQEMIDCIPWSQFDNKLEMARGYAKLNGKENDIEYVLTRLFPIIRYHGDYKINSMNFLDLHLDQLYQRKGFATEAKIASFNTKNTTKVETLLNNEYEDVVNHQPNPVLTEELDYNMEWILKIHELCKSHGCELVLTKIPVHATSRYNGYWSLEKHNLIQALADDLGIKFVDLVFEDGVGIDWSCDTTDTAAHMNYHGAKKVSIFLSDWLMEHFDTEAMAASCDRASWDRQLKYYDWEMAYIDMEMEGDLEQYFKMVKPMNTTMFVSVSGNIAECWTDELQKSFEKATGTKIDLRNEGCAAYVSASNNGKLIDESADKSSVEMKHKLKNGTSYTLTSQAGSNGSGSIKVNSTEMASNDPGLRIVVYDYDLKCVVDSVLFSVKNDKLVGKHKNRNYVTKFRLALIESQARDNENA